jgi:hypothetical protein
MLAGQLHVGMADTVMPGKRICAAERFLLSAEIASNLLLASIVDRILVPGKIVRPREHRIARLVRARVNAIASVRARLTV